MKKLLIFIIIAAAGYYAYEYLIKEKQVLEVHDTKVVNTNFSMDIEAPALSPLSSGSVQGTVKNLSDKTVTNIKLKYKLDGKPVEAVIYQLNPGEQTSFSTQTITIRGSGSAYYLEEMTFE